MSGQSIQDRIQAARHSIAGQGLAKAVCKATTEEVMGPKKKHLDYLLQCTNEPNVSIPQLANLLIERTQHPNWVVVYKSLVTLHNMMNYGNERFTQFLASNNCNLQLTNFLDKQGVQGYDMSTYIRRYSKYLNEKALSYRTMAFDFCKVKRGKDDGLLRTMDTEKLLKTLPVLQQHLDALLEFDVTPNELTNGVVNACFMILFKDLIRLFACYNDGIINLLELYFEMNKKNAKDALECYKKFLTRMERCAEFLKVAEAVGIDKGDIPDLAKAPSSLLTALEEHLKSLDGTKKPKDRSKVAAAINQLQSPTSPTAISDDEKKKILEEESKQLETLKASASSENTAAQAQTQSATSPTSDTAAGATAAAAAPNPFGVDTQDASLDLFGAGGGTQAGFGGYGYDQGNDLLGLGAGSGPGSGPNPFGEDSNNPFASPAPAPAQSASPWGPPAASKAQTITNGTSHPTQASGSSGFISDDQFAKAFGSTQANSSAGFDGFGDLLKPQSQSKGPSMSTMAAQSSPAKQSGGTPMVKGDLDSSLANLAGNLSINGPAGATKSDMNWNQNSGEKKMTGGTTFAPFAASMTAQTPAAPPPPTSGYNGAMPGAQQQFYPQQPMGVNPAAFNGTAAPTNWGAGMNKSPMMGGFSQPVMGGAPGMGAGQPVMGMQPMGMQPAPNMFGAAPAASSQPPAQSANSDPFGSLL